MKELKCTGCNEPQIIGEYLHINNKGDYCEKCYNKYKHNKLYFEKLKEYICKKLEVPKVSGTIIGQIKQLKEKGYTYKQILYICYYTFIVEKKLNKKYYNTIGIVFYYVDAALEHAELNNIDFSIEDKFTKDKEKYWTDAKIKQVERKFQNSITIQETRKQKNEKKKQSVFEILKSLPEPKEKKIITIKPKKLTKLKTPIKITKEFALESQLENYLIYNLDKIEEGLKYLDNQFIVESGRIDILARDKNNVLCIIELKNVDDCKDLIWQCTYYPSQFVEPSRMIAVCPDYSQRLKDGFSLLPHVETYKFDYIRLTKKVTTLQINRVSF